MRLIEVEKETSKNTTFDTRKYSMTQILIMTFLEEMHQLNHLVIWYIIHKHAHRGGSHKHKCILLNTPKRLVHNLT